MEKSGLQTIIVLHGRRLLKNGGTKVSYYLNERHSWVKSSLPLCSNSSSFGLSNIKICVHSKYPKFHEVVSDLEREPLQALLRSASDFCSLFRKTLKDVSHIRYGSWCIDSGCKPHLLYKSIIVTLADDRMLFPMARIKFKHLNYWNMTCRNFLS